MRSRISTIHKHFKRVSKYSKLFVIFKPVLGSQFFAPSSRALVNAYKYPYFKIFPNRFKPICLYSGRARGNLSKYYLSRMIFKKFSMKGDLPGFRKSRW